MDLVRSFGWEIASILFRTTIIFEQVISPITRHSAVCVWMPLVMSTTKIIRSIIWAPPMMVLIREAETSQQADAYHWEVASVKLDYVESFSFLMYTSFKCCIGLGM